MVPVATAGKKDDTTFYLVIPFSVFPVLFLSFILVVEYPHLPYSIAVI